MFRWLKKKREAVGHDSTLQNVKSRGGKTSKVNAKLTLKATILPPSGDIYAIQVNGRVAQTLEALVRAGQSGTTVREMGLWALRLAAHIHSLRHEYGLEDGIVTTMEPHDGGRHARYHLLWPVVITACK